MNASSCTLLLLVLLFASCKSEDPAPLRFDSIIIGETSKMNVTPFAPETILINGHETGSIHLDMNFDGEEDVTITLNNRPVSGGGSIQQATVWAKNRETWILFSQVPDTIFVDRLSDTNSSQNPTEIFHRFLYSNHIQYDSILMFNSHPIALSMQEGQTISMGSDFTSELSALASYEIQSPSTPRDTQWIDSTTVSYTLEYLDMKYGEFPYGEVRYIGLISHGRLGWIKLKVISQFEVHVYEQAIQK